MTGLQQRIWGNKVARGFNTTDVPYEICLLQGEMAELFTAWKDSGEVGSEVADVAIFTFGLAEMLGVDLLTEVEKKVAINESRRYEIGPTGHPVRLGVTE